MSSLAVVVFASDEWVRQLDAALADVALEGPPLRIRYRFPGAGDTMVGYDLVLGSGAAAVAFDPTATAQDPGGSDPAGDHRATPTVTITQPLTLAAEVAAGRESAQRALLRGDINVSGDVPALVAWAASLAQLDAAMAPLRSRTGWNGLLR